MIGGGAEAAKASCAVVVAVGTPVLGEVLAAHEEGNSMRRSSPKYVRCA